MGVVPVLLVGLFSEVVGYAGQGEPVLAEAKVQPAVVVVVVLPPVQ